MEVQMSRKDINSRWGITIKEDFGETYVAKLVPGTPAGSSGLEIGDVITHVNGQNVKTHGKRQVLDIIRKLRSMSLKFERPKDSSKKSPIGTSRSEDRDVVFVSSTVLKDDSSPPPKIPKNETGKIAKKRGRPAGSKKKSPKFQLVKPKTSQPVPQMKTMLEKLAESSDSEDEHTSSNDEVFLDVQIEKTSKTPRRGKSKERKTSTSTKKSKKARSQSITTLIPPPLEDCDFISAYSINEAESEVDPYSWEEENPYKQMNNGAAKNNGNTKQISDNNPLDHLAKCAEVELTKIAADNEKSNKALQASLLEQEIVIEELKKTRLEERRKIGEEQFKNKQLTRAFKSLQSSTRLENEKLKEELLRAHQKNAEIQAKYDEMKEAQDSVCKELAKTRNDLRIALAKEEARKQKRTDAVSKATELMLLLQTDEA